MIALIILALLNLVDLLMTNWALGRGFREINPFMRWLMGLIGIIPALALTKVLALASCYLLLPDYEWVIWVCVAGYAALTAWNTRAILRWKRR